MTASENNAQVAQGSSGKNLYTKHVIIYIDHTPPLQDLVSYITYTYMHSDTYIF